MPQLFHRSVNAISRVAIFGTLLILLGGSAALAVVYRSYYVTGAHIAYMQPVPFSHQHHVGVLGIDCRYCHTGVETSSFAGMPPTKTCMNCHQLIWAQSQVLSQVRESLRSDEPIEWRRVHNLPGFAYFDHSIHVAKGVGCAECHGKIDGMPLTWQTRSLLMEWCLDCHRAPAQHLRPRDEVFNLAWRPEDETDSTTGRPHTRESLGAELLSEFKIHDAAHLTSCSTCHR